MMENGFSPAGLRVLVVDDDPTWLKILEKMLKKCSYEVTTCGLARDALRLLRERKDGFDIVISDVYMPDMDGFKLLEHVGLEMDLPVIMMSVDGETSRVMKGVQHGACDYLLKPIRMKELRNIWQHVLRKKIHEIRDIEILEGVEGFQMTRNGSDYSNDGYFFGGEDVNSMKKRKDIENKHIDDFGESSSAKKARVVWSVVLHQKFVKAVNQIGFDKVGPKKILDLMNVPGLTRENVASHLQKYRLYLSRLQKENDVKICAGGLNHPDSPSRDSAGNLAIQNSIKLQHNDVPNGSYGFSGDNNLLIQDMGPQSHEGDQEGIVSKLATEPKRALVVDVPETRKPRSPQIKFGPSFRPSEGEVNFAAFDSSTFPSQYPWHGLPDIQLKQEPQSLNLDDGFNNLPLSIDYPRSAPFISSRPSLPEKDEYKINKRNRVSSSTSEVGSNFNENMAYMKNQAVELTSTGTSNMGKQDFDLSCIMRLESAKKSINWGIQPFANLDEEWKASLVQNDCYSRNFGLQNIDFQGYFEQGFLGDHIPNDGLRFDYENLYEPTEYHSLIDQSLFIT